MPPRGLPRLLQPTVTRPYKYQNIAKTSEVFITFCFLYYSPPFLTTSNMFYILVTGTIFFNIIFSTRPSASASEQKPSIKMLNELT